ncbi:MAG: hypothetical protein A3H01_00105 [Candidatus Wildermuthbacteria bacterium RIFCSPLOWO2_12_FULL_40_9]|uniref:Cob(I)yrinic acid a,c-diamide adenosyltransferase n=2 Tax=Candidatus Wildermuthiibacteriota TaxID=1817923 RepID=A0A1G2RG60_9BACT|nr:MAG: hypothetical protein A3F15_01470 [Candidatus Wildermuthbacteria bacterium RIFCSPHIGHO2_12_FULL_40_12]OHA76147.1 MAG: hypothetical protein A3H01_00105 [Candidatus Wildermuthbacteria bacterium RIFCSPLOWO2_12_FULL_40_9]
MIFVFTGNGKGKTTSAIGQAIRAVGQGKKVLMIQFIKSPKWPSGEEKIIRELSPRFQIIKGGKGFVGIMGDSLPRKIHEEAAKATLILAKKAIRSKKFGLIILDEIIVAIDLKLISMAAVIAVLQEVSEEIDLILTGRGAPKGLIKFADLVTDFGEVKHYYQKKVIAKKSREY